MTLTQIADILNDSIVPAIMGDAFTVNPNLDNIVDLGTAIGSLTADQFKDYLNEFASGVARTVVDTRDYTPEQLPLRVNSQEYGGLVQSIKTDFTEVRDSVIYSLIDDTTYSDVNKFFGSSFDNKIYEKDTTWEVVKSIPKTMYKKAFTSAEGVTQITALIETGIRRSLNRAESALEHTLIADLAKNAVQIDLVTAYNAMITSELASVVTGEGVTGTSGEAAVDILAGQQVEVTSDNCIYNEAFMKWAIMTIKNVIKASRFANQKYNDGTLSTWLGSDDTTMIFNSSFLEALNVIIKSDVIHKDELSLGTVYDTPFWNIQPESLIPTVANSSTIIDNTGDKAATNTQIDNVVGLVYDRYACGYTETPIPTRTSYNAHGDFFNIFTDVNVRYYVDTRNTAIAFTLN